MVPFAGIAENRISEKIFCFSDFAVVANIFSQETYWHSGALLEQPALDVWPVSVESLGLVEHELGKVVDVLDIPSPRRRNRWLVLVLAEEPPDLAANRGLGRCPVGPVDGEVFPDALDEVSRDFGELRVDVRRVGAAGKRVVEGGLLRGETQLLVTATGFAQAPGDLNETLDNFGA